MFVCPCIVCVCACVLWQKKVNTLENIWILNLLPHAQSPLYYLHLPWLPLTLGGGVGWNHITGRNHVVSLAMIFFPVWLLASVWVFGLEKINDLFIKKRLSTPKETSMREYQTPKLSKRCRELQPIKELSQYHVIFPYAGNVWLVHALSDCCCHVCFSRGLKEWRIW